MKTTTLKAILVAGLAALLFGCGTVPLPGSGKLGGIANRMNGNQLLTLNQSTQGAAEKGSAANQASEPGRQVATGGIVNNFYIGSNSAKQEAEKSVDALKAAANVSTIGTGSSDIAGSPTVAPAEPTPKEVETPTPNNDNPTTPPE